MTRMKRISCREPPSNETMPKPKTISCVESPTAICVVVLWASEVTKLGECDIWCKALETRIHVVVEDKTSVGREYPFLGGEGSNFREAILCYYLASSRSSRHFQHLETRCPSLPQKLQESPMYFLILEEDSLDMEYFPLGGGFLLFYFWGGLEECLMFVESNLGFYFYF